MLRAVYPWHNPQMTEGDDTLSVLREIRDDQRTMLERQREHLEIARTQLEQARNQIAESIALQREAVSRARTATRVAIPGILLCIAAIAYLVVRYL
jgi:t-SNARE complex subunit (syntaxin)